MRFHWFLPTSGDGRAIIGGGHGLRRGYGLPVTGAFRPPSIDYLGQIARSAEQLGFEAVLTPTGTWCEDAWLVTAALTQVTTRLKFLVAFRPGVLSPTLAAQMAATYQRISGGRLLLNIVTGGEGAEQRRFGDHLDKVERYARTDEFLSVVRGAWDGPFDFQGTYYDVEEATVAERPDPLPELYFGGSSAAAGPVAARHVDVYLTWGEPPAQVAEKLEWVRSLAAQEGRTLRFGVRLHVITRDTSSAAWAEAGRLLDQIDAEDIEAARAVLGRSDSVGQKRMLALSKGFRGGAVRDLEIHPGLWAGVGLVRGGAGTSLVGSHAEVADLIEEYASVGVSEFVLSGYPHLEEAYWFGEGVLPELRRRGLLGDPAAGAANGTADPAAEGPVRLTA
ncbi:LLM class flavin-dependent oxidoreductase [Microtetraspora sp. AC03309]|uniref:LLM class flavin-dependent oxidoreductase n=1 Tax=Microtetraspora sp. AC03309 TaxID=2779376 RepID=UPI001E448404|nr:LLM class flavin-dependent oxidoreductase [Microtetraspora sp. AC03309]MCC5579447.1 LLM class flavin-dependent oxidoreductase [Microtetraspora sp. AC03309]